MRQWYLAGTRPVREKQTTWAHLGRVPRQRVCCPQFIVICPPHVLIAAGWIQSRALYFIVSGYRRDSGAPPPRFLPGRSLWGAGGIVQLERRAICSALVGRPGRRATKGAEVDTGAVSCCRHSSQTSTSAGRNRRSLPSLMTGGRSPPDEWRL